MKRKHMASMGVGALSVDGGAPLDEAVARDITMDAPAAAGAAGDGPAAAAARPAAMSCRSVLDACTCAVPAGAAGAGPAAGMAEAGAAETGSAEAVPAAVGRTGGACA